MSNNAIKINSLPVPTWNKLKVNENFIEFSDIETLKAEIKCENSVVSYGQAYESSCPTGTGRDTDILFKDAVSIKLESGKKDKAYADFKGQESAGTAVLIEVGEGAELTLVERIGSDGFNCMVRTYAKVAKGGTFHLVQIVTGTENSTTVCDVGADADDKAVIKLTRMYISKGDMFSGTCINLNGKSSELESNTGYLVRSEKTLDMNLIANHIGKKTVSNITADGTLRENAQKVFRGTIDLRNGCAGANGREEENVLLLGDDIVNKTIPLILCSEEDVSGTHGATIGELSPDVLFYFGSRGISKEDAERIMAASHLERLGSFTDSETAELIHKTIKEETT